MELLKLQQLYIAEGIDVTKASASEEFVAIGINIYIYVYIYVYIYTYTYIHTVADHLLGICLQRKISFLQSTIASRTTDQLISFTNAMSLGIQQQMLQCL